MQDIINKMTKKELYEATMDKYGIPNQIEMMIEECSELIQAIQKEKRFKNADSINHVCEEIADVEIMIEQMRIIYPSVVIDRNKSEKLERLEKRVLND